MRIFITGGSGFIGTSLALEYRRRGAEVVTLTLDATDAERQNLQELRNAGVEIVLGSVAETDKAAAACAGTDVIHHIAAAMREANVPERHFWDVNVDATRALLEAAESAGVGRFVYCSSMGVMGKAPPKPADETTACQPQDIYQVTKHAAEELCLECSVKGQLPLTIVRPADVYGPRDRRLLKLFRGVKSGKFAMVGSGANEHDMVYIDDLVQGMLLAAERPQAPGEVFFLAGGAPVRIRDLVGLVAEELGVRPPRIRIPLAPLYAAAFAVEMLCRPFGIQPPLYRRRVDFFRTDFAFSIDKARRMLGYEPAFDLRAGLRATRAWYEAEGLL